MQVRKDSKTYGKIGFLVLLSFIASWTQAGEIRFSDVSDAAGLGEGIYFSPTGHSLGVNWIDFDLDGWPDLFLVGGGNGTRPHLYRNQRDGTFAHVDHLLPELPQVEMSGSIFADFDRDGDPDLFIYTDNEQWRTLLDNNPDGHPNLFLLNRWFDPTPRAPTDPLFAEQASAIGLDDLAFPAFGTLPGYRSKTASWLDYDRDGCIDLYIGHLVMNGGDIAANRDRFYRNLCNGTFADVTSTVGIEPDAYRGALVSGGFHLNDDLWPDLYVANVSSQPPAPDDFIYLNQGIPKEGSFSAVTATFSEITGMMPGIGDDAQAAMGIDVGDPDLDGDWDLYISDVIESHLDAKPLGNVLYLGNGDGTFADNTAPEAGIIGHNSWGVNFFDADQDGWEDLFISTISNAETDFFYHNQGTDLEGQVSFVNVAEEAGVTTGNARGSAVADYDRDGDLDFAVINQEGTLQLFRNDSINTGHWIAFELRGTSSNTDAIGAIVEVTTGEIVRKRQVKGGSSAHSQDAFSVHVGLGSATTVDRVLIRWPSGLETHFTDLPVDRYISVVEGASLADSFESGDLSTWTLFR